MVCANHFFVPITANLAFPTKPNHSSANVVVHPFQGFSLLESFLAGFYNMSSLTVSKGVQTFFAGIGEILAKDGLREYLDSIVFVTGNESAGTLMVNAFLS